MVCLGGHERRLLIYSVDQRSGTWGADSRPGRQEEFGADVQEVGCRGERCWRDSIQTTERPGLDYKRA